MHTGVLPKELAILSISWLNAHPARQRQEPEAIIVHLIENRGPDLSATFQSSYLTIQLHVTGADGEHIGQVGK